MNTIPLAIEHICTIMQSLTAGQSTRFEIHDGHLRLMSPSKPNGERQGRNFHIYETMAQRNTPAFALIDFAGVLLRFLELFPDRFEQLVPHIVALGQYMYPDERNNWADLWSNPE